MADEIIVLITCPAAASENLARTLVEERLAACVNILDNVKSIYEWQGKICNEIEQLLVVKSNRATFDMLCERVKALHSYEVPEIIALPIDLGYAPYLHWLNSAIQRPTLI